MYLLTVTETADELQLFNKTQYQTFKIKRKNNA